MFVVLLTTIGAAALVGAWKTKISQVNLKATVGYGPIAIRLPAGWKVTQRTIGTMETLIAEEPANPARTLNIRTAQLDEQTDPLSFLVNSGILAIPQRDLDQAAGDPNQVEALDIPGGAGLLMHIPANGAGVRRPLLLGCIIFKAGQVVVLELDTPAANNTADAALLYDVTRSIRLVDGKTIKLKEVPGLPI